MPGHSVLAPSAAHRWLVCNPSARLEEGIQSSSIYAEEGTLAHSMAEAMLKAPKGKIPAKRMAVFQANELYSDEMPYEVKKYVEYVDDKTRGDTLRFIETRLDMSFLAPGQKGTADAIVINDGILTIIDLKYGKGVRVEAENNPQQMLYAAAALYMFDVMFDIKTVILCIHQPRLNHVSEWEIEAEALREWVQQTAIPNAIRAFAGEGETKAGSHCKFCKVKGKCRALSELNLSLAEHEFKAAPFLSDDEIADILKRLPVFKDWTSAIEDYARNQLLDGKSIPGFKLVEGRGSRKIVNEDGLITALNSAGYTEIYKTELLGLTALEGLMGKKQFSILSNDFIERVKGSPTMALESDPRPEYSECIFNPVKQ